MGCIHSRKTQICPGNRGLRQSDINIVQETWTLISEQKEKFGVFVYNSFLSQEKELRHLFPRLVVAEDGQEAFRVNEAAVRRHALLVMDGLGLAVDLLTDTVRLQHFLQQVGLRHSRAGVQPDMLQKLYPAIDAGLHMLLGKTYTKGTRKAWEHFFFLMTDTMITAMMQHGSQ